jgi:transcriptional regulator with XRE-family HTH domain
MTALPFRLKVLRRRHKFSLETLSRMTGVTKSYLSKLERGLSEPSISTILKLASAYGLSISDLVGEHVDETDGIAIVRKSERTSITGPKNSDNDTLYQILGSANSARSLIPFIALPPFEFPDDDSIFPHEGEEFIFVLKGTIEVKISERVFKLNSGDSIHFDSEYPHRLRSSGKKVAEVLVMTLRVR